MKENTHSTQGIHQAGFATKAIHAGHSPDPVTGAIIPPISLSTTFLQKSPGEHTGFEYSRTGNPTRNQFEMAMASLENAKFGLAFSSGSSATAAIISSLPNGSHILSINDVYGGTSRYFTKVASNFGYTTDFLDLEDPTVLLQHIRPNTRMVWIESPTNPTLRLTDLAAIAKLAHEAKPDLLVTVDNTFLSPYFQTPLDLGADLVVHSATKYLNGHSDALLGVICTNQQEVYEKLKFLQNAVGWVPSPFDCYMAHRGLKTLALRMQQHASNALAIAKVLAQSPFVEKVSYPGFVQAPFKHQQMRGDGGMVTFWIKSNPKVFLQHLKYFKLGESLGGVESLVEIPSVMTHGAVDPAMRQLLGIDDNLIRLSVGIENEKDLIQDILQALEKA
ncbi:hypothetical protein HMI55_001962, partial [Coelomomyces lativittatus]